MTISEFLRTPPPVPPPNVSLHEFVAHFNPHRRWQVRHLRTLQRKLETNLRKLARVRERIVKTAERFHLRASVGSIQVVNPINNRVVRCIVPFGLVSGKAGFQALNDLWLAADCGFVKADQVHARTVETALEHIELEAEDNRRDLALIETALAGVAR
jgi:hypothetical protein